MERTVLAALPVPIKKALTSLGLIWSSRWFPRAGMIWACNRVRYLALVLGAQSCVPGRFRSLSRFTLALPLRAATVEIAAHPDAAAASVGRGGVGGGLFALCWRCAHRCEVLSGVWSPGCPAGMPGVWRTGRDRQFLPGVWHGVGRGACVGRAVGCAGR